MFLTVDYTKCNKDNLCILECPARIIEMQEQGPVPVDGAEDICIRCGHCVAVCPEAALTLEFLEPASCVEVDENLIISPEQAEQFLKSRRSIRTYRKKAVPRDLLEKSLSIASYAPTASNRQSVKWIVLYEREDVETLTRHVIDWMKYMIANKPDVAEMFNMAKLVEGWDQDIDRICRDAPHLVFAYALKEMGNGKADCDTALAYLELLLPSLGLGSCWAGYVTFAANVWPPIKEFLGIGDDHVIHGAVMAGYPKFTYKRIPKRNEPNIVFK